MVTARCTRGLTTGTTAATNCSSGIGQSADDKRTPRTATSASDAVCHCLACCYVTADVTSAAPQLVVAAAARKSGGKTRADDADESPPAYDPPSEAAAFVASASAAAFVLLAALLAVALSSAALLTVASMVPMADAAARELRGPQSAADHLHTWHQQQQRGRRPYDHDDHDDSDDDASRSKRQLFNKNANREPGVIALTFSLIGGTISDTRQAFRNVSSIVRETINEASKDPAASTSTATAGGADQMMMAAANAADNEIGAGAASTTAATDQRAVGQTLGKLLGRNYRGLRRLFDSELRSAIKNSPGNVRNFAVELMGSIGQSLRPSNLFTLGQINNTMSAAGRK